jgi:CheY-like chemotaxis protein
MTTSAPPIRRVLVVEDNDESRAALRQLLEQWGFIVEEAEDGVEGVRKARDWRPDAAVVDLGMPVLDGFGVARRMRESLGERVLLVALTGYGGAGDRAKALSAGFDAHLLKPCDPAHLHRLLEKAPPPPF